MTAEVSADDVSVTCERGILISHRDQPFTLNANVPYTLSGRFEALGTAGVDPETVALHYRVDGGSFHDVAMIPTGLPDEYAGDVPAQPWSSRIEYYLSARDAFGDPWTYPRSAPLWCCLFRVDEEFSDGLEQDGGWSTVPLGDNALTGVWFRADPNGTFYNGYEVQPEDDHSAAPGTHCYVTGNGAPGGAAGENDVDGGRTTLLTPVYDLRGGSGVDISYWRWFTNNRGYNPGEDFWTVEISNDGGQSWSTVEHTTLSSNGWERVTIDLETYFPDASLVQLRFVAEDCGTGALVEAAVDDFTLTVEFDPSAVGEDQAIGDEWRAATAGRSALWQNHPNPLRVGTEIAFRLAEAGPAQLGVYDLTGRLVSLLASGSMAAGDHRVSWDGDDDRGRPLPAGVYAYRLKDRGGVTSRHLVLIR